MRLRVFILFVAASLSIACVTAKPGAVGKTSSHPFIGNCPAGSERARDMVENFLTNPQGVEARAETGTEGISTSQIQVVNDASVCQQLSTEYSELISKEASYTESGYKVSYYKAGSFYFVVALFMQPTAPDHFASGYSRIYIHDENLNRIAGYAG